MDKKKNTHALKVTVHRRFGEDHHKFFHDIYLFARLFCCDGMRSEMGQEMTFIQSFGLLAQSDI